MYLPYGGQLNISVYILSALEACVRYYSYPETKFGDFQADKLWREESKPENVLTVFFYILIFYLEINVVKAT